MQVRFKRIQQRLEERDETDSRMSGIKCKIGDFGELVSSTEEQRDGLAFQKSAQRKALEEKETENERLGALFCARAMTQKASDSNTVGRFEPPESRFPP